MKKIISILVVISFVLVSFSGCVKKSDSTAQSQPKRLKKVTVILDWTPNTNHTGLFVAKDKGYYEQEGLDVNIIQPSSDTAAALVAAGKGDFGISFQEEVTYAKTADTPLPIRAIAAVIQHNTSGFASPAAKNIKTPKDFEGKTYGGWGAPSEEATIKALMQKYGADYKKVKMVNIGDADFLSSVQKNVDFSWIFYGWEGIDAQLKNVPINFIKLTDIDKNLDFYTPVIVTNDKLLNSDPDLVRKFLKATSEGYDYAVQNPEDAANILIKNAPEIDKNLAVESQKYLSKEYTADAPKWGVMKEEVWTNYSNWMYNQGLLKKKLDVKEAYTNDYLPQ